MSLRRRLILSYALVVIVCLGIIGIAVSVLVQSYRDRLTMTYLASIAQPIYVQLRLSVSADVASIRQWTGLQEQATDNNVHILLLDARGNITRQISPNPEENESPLEPVSGLPARFSKASRENLRQNRGRRTSTRHNLWDFRVVPQGLSFWPCPAGTARAGIAR